MAIPQLVTIASLYVIEFIVFAFYSIRFIFFELKCRGIGKILQNHFIIVILIGSFSFLALLICSFSLYFGLQGYIPLVLPSNDIQAIRFIFILFASFAHIYGLFLRSKALFLTSPNFLKVIKMLVIFYFISFLASFTFHE
jgi:hypothetical protein